MKSEHGPEASTTCHTRYGDFLALVNTVRACLMPWD